MSNIAPTRVVKVSVTEDVATLLPPSGRSYYLRCSRSGVVWR